MSPLPLYKGTSTLLLHSSGIFSPSRSLLKKFTRNSTPLFPKAIHTSTGVSSGPCTFPFFIFLNPVLTSSTEMSSTCLFLFSVFISLLSVGFSWLSKSSKYSFHLCFTFSSSSSISPVLLLITLTCCTSLLCLFLCFAS